MEAAWPVWMGAGYLAGIVVLLADIRYTWSVACTSLVETAGMGLDPTALPWTLRAALGGLIVVALAVWPLWVWMPVLGWWLARKKGCDCDDG